MLDWTTLNALLKASVKLYETYVAITEAPLCLTETVTEEKVMANVEAFAEWEKALIAAGLIQPPEEKSIEEVLK